MSAPATTREAVDLLATLQAPEERNGILPGTIRGPDGWEEGLGAGLEVYVGEGTWRPLGAIVGDHRAGLILHCGRLTAGLSWDLGEMKLRRQQGADDADA